MTVNQLLNTSQIHDRLIIVIKSKLVEDSSTTVVYHVSLRFPKFPRGHL